MFLNVTDWRVRSLFPRFQIRAFWAYLTVGVFLACTRVIAGTIQIYFLFTYENFGAYHRCTQILVEFFNFEF